MGKTDKNRGLYEQLVNVHAGELYRFALRLCGRTDIAEDLVQETFYEAWRSIHSLRNAKSGRAWMFQILRHRYAHWVRDSGRRLQPRVSIEQIENEADPGCVSVLDSLSLREVLQKGLMDLDDRYKEPFLMVFLSGFSCRETAESLGIPLGTVLSRIHRARSFLRRFIRDIDRDADKQQDSHSDQIFDNGDSPPRLHIAGGS